MIKILDYGLGNIQSFVNSYKKLDIAVKPIYSLKEISTSDKLILPGVGSFDFAMKKLISTFNIEELNNIVLNNKTPIMGICVGMQMLGINSEEGKLNGLNWIEGKILKLKKSEKYKLPHMGWNSINILQKSTPILKGINQKNRFYFLHSYYFDCENKDYIIGECDYTQTFPCIINKENIYGIQCHPEKSHKDGITLLYNYSKL